MKGLKRTILTPILNEDKGESEKKSKDKTLDKADILLYMGASIRDKIAGADIPNDLVNVESIVPDKDGNGGKLKFSINKNTFEVTCNKSLDGAGPGSSIVALKLPSILTGKLDEEKLNDADFILCLTAFRKMCEVKAFGDALAWLVVTACGQVTEKE